MFHITDDGPKKCSTTPDKCPVKKDGNAVEHFNNKEDAYVAYEKQMNNQILVNHCKKNKITNLNENSWKEYGFKSLDFDPSVELSYSESKRLMDESKKEVANLTKAEKEALHFYTTSSFKDFQRVLFRRKELNTEADAETYKMAMNDLDNALDKTEKKDKIVYRGIRGTASILSPDFDNINVDDLLNEFEEISENWDDDFDFNDNTFIDDFDEDKKLNDYVKNNLSLGKTITFDGYQSTTYSPAVASQYSNGGILFEVKTPEGMNIKSVSKFESEEEVLLPRETKYMVVGVQKDELQLVGAKYIVQLVAINDDNTIKTVNNIKKPKKSTWDDLMQKPLENPIPESVL